MLLRLLRSYVCIHICVWCIITFMKYRPQQNSQTRTDLHTFNHDSTLNVKVAS